MFKLTPPVPPLTLWTEKVLYSFMGGPAGGLIFGSNGALFGTTQTAGTSDFGTVFKLKPPAAGHTKWTEKVLYSFKGGNDGSNPIASLIFNSKGALFGTTAEGGGTVPGFGTVFKLKPPVPPATNWTEKVLYRFQAGSDGAYPHAGLIFDGSGALYGTTAAGGGTAGFGIVFKLTPPAAGQTQWTETVLHSFASALNEPHLSTADLIFDGSGVLFYGTTIFGGTGDNGTVFTLTPAGTESVLHRFKGEPGGSEPWDGLIFDTSGALYGTTRIGGSGAGPTCTTGCGTVFKLTPPVLPATKWTETVLHSFTAGSDGQFPRAGLILDSSGALYGTTYQGGTSNFGTVFKVK